MARGIYVLVWNPTTRLPSFPSSAPAWVRCGDPASNQVLVMVNAPSLTAFNNGAIKIVQGNAFEYANQFGVEGQDLSALFAGNEVNPPPYEIPEGEALTGYTPTLPETVGSLEDSLAGVSIGTVELAAGTYTCSNVTIPNDVIVRPETGAHVVINNAGLIHIPDTGELWDVDILNAGIQTRYNNEQLGIQLYRGGKLIGCTINNLLSSGVHWQGGAAGFSGAILECHIYNNGYVDSLWKGHGHAIYTHNRNGDLRTFARNIVLGGFGDRCFQGYSGTLNDLQNYLVQNNLFAGRENIVLGSSGVKKNIVWRDNMQYNHSLRLGVATQAGTCEDVTLIDNLFGKVDVSIDCFVTVTESGNQTYAANGGLRDYPMIEDPVTIKIVPCTLSQRKIAHIGIMHPEETEATEAVLDLSSLSLDNGDYELVNAHNPDESHEFTYNGSDVILPLTGWTAQRPIAWTGVWNTLTHPEFSAWILRAA